MFVLVQVTDAIRHQYPVLTHYDSSYTRTLKCILFLLVPLCVVLVRAPACTLSFAATPGAIVTGIFFYVSYLPYAWQNHDYYALSLANKLCCCLLPNAAMGFGLLLILVHEGTGV